MNFNQETKKALAEGRPEDAISKMLSFSEEIGTDFTNEITVLSGELNQWQKEFRLGFEPSQSTLNRINFALLEIVDKIETSYDLLDLNSGDMDTFKLVFDSNVDDQRSELGWYNSEGRSKNPDSITIIKGSFEEKVFVVKAKAQEYVGITKAINILEGIVELEYLAVSSPVEHAENLMFILIPMKHNSFKQKGYIEVGSDFQNDPNNPFSPYRKRFIIPREHIGDGKWHSVSMDFDFSYIPDSFYSVFAPRINEGAQIKGPGELHFKNIKILRK